MVMRRANGRAGAGLQAELFPFLAVLACIIGTLVLLIILVTSSVLGAKRSITLVARDEQGSNLALRPHVIEVRHDGVQLHSTREFVATASLGRADTPLRRLLVEVQAKRGEEYIIVAVRPGGYPNFPRVRRQIEGRGIRIGYEPIDDEWTIRARRAP